MKAIVMHAFGGPEVLKTEEIREPIPEHYEVLIEVKAAGVNPVDYKVRSGSFRRRETELPAVLGRDVSGTVAGVGAGITGLNVGDDVYAFLASRSGGYAGFAIAKENEVALKPTTLDHVHAAAVPLAAVTAWQALFDHGRLEAGQRVLIHGAAGGVGHFAVQFADLKGATVIATAGPNDLELVKELGADQVINYKDGAFEQKIRDINLVVDLVGGEVQERSWQVLRDGGAMVSTLQPPSKDLAAKHHARAVIFMAEPKRELLEEIADLIDAGKVRVKLQKTYALEEAARAQDELEHGHSTGKRVLEVV